MKYRTLEQFTTIAENAYNGNWSDAFNNCVDFGFYANDLIKMNEEHELIQDVTDLAILAEGAMKIRGQKNMI